MGDRHTDRSLQQSVTLKACIKYEKSQDEGFVTQTEKFMKAPWEETSGWGLEE